MKTVLLHEKTFARLAVSLKPFERQLEIILMDDAGAFRRAATGESLAGVEPEIVFGNADAWFGAGVRNFMKTVVSSPRLDWFQSAAAGVENPALVMIGKNARQYTTNHTQAESMAEWAIWQALDFLKRGPEHRAQQAAQAWARLRMRDIAGSRWLVIGYGSIGEAVGKRVAALGGVVTGVKRSGETAPGASRIVRPGALMQELPGADIVLLCTPHTPDTESLAGTAFFAAMQSDALFMNLGRGALVDEAALIAALDSGRPALAVLDVTREEPLPETSPLWRHPRIVITPHDSSNTPGTVHGADATFLANLQHYLRGEPLRHLVDKSVFQG